MCITCTVILCMYMYMCTCVLCVYRMYERFCGEMVWECEEHEGHDITLLAPPTSQHWIGIYGNSGVWLLRSRRLSEHTQLLSQALFPIATNADEVYTHTVHVHVHTIQCMYLSESRPLPETIWSKVVSWQQLSVSCGAILCQPPSLL